MSTIRDRILSHPDLAERLTQPPLDYPRPEMWNGFIPPTTCDTGALNTSPRRKALLDLAAEAHRREQQRSIA